MYDLVSATPMVDFSGFDLYEAACFLLSSWPIVTQIDGTGQLIISSHSCYV